MNINPNNPQPSMLACPLCPNSTRLFRGAHGLNIHKSKVHRSLTQTITSTVDHNSTSNIQVSDIQHTRESFLKLKKCNRVLKHIPKGSRSIVAEKLISLINDAIISNNSTSWFALLSFPFIALQLPERDTSTHNNKNLTSIVKENTLHFKNSILNTPYNYRIYNFNIHKKAEAKVCDGDIKGAVRLLTSECSLAPNNDNTLQSLKSKHPQPILSLQSPEPPNNINFPSITDTDIIDGINSFNSGSAGGIDGLRPNHLKELISQSAGNNGFRLISAIRLLCTFLFQGKLNSDICPYLYGANLCALAKKDGGIRPIAVGNIFRRLVAKICCKHVRQEMGEFLRPTQLGFGTSLGCEAAIHATRKYVLNSTGLDKIILKLDIKNAFNCLARTKILQQVTENIPILYPFINQCYCYESNLFYNNEIINSSEGIQQGDPLGPLLFSIVIQPIIKSLNSELNIWYLDDGTLGGDINTVLSDLAKLTSSFSQLGLDINFAKSEIYSCSVKNNDHIKFLFPDIKIITNQNFQLLGAPITLESVELFINKKLSQIKILHDHLPHLHSHIAYTLLKFCFSIPKFTYIIRTTPIWKFPNLVSLIDNTIKSCAELVLNVHLSEYQWSQASLPIKSGGIGIRRVSDVALPAFIASCYGVSDLITTILPNLGATSEIPYLIDSIEAFKTISDDLPVQLSSQYQWDNINIQHLQKKLLAYFSGSDIARFKAAITSESGLWLEALPSPSLGTFLDDHSLRIAIALRLGANICQPHQCVCGTQVLANGHHGLSCSRSSGRLSRHHNLNDIIRRALTSANVPSILEPYGLSRVDGKRPDGLTLVPWQRGRSLIWDVTCVDSFAASHLRACMSSSGAAAEAAAKLKHTKYQNLKSEYLFVPFAVETTGVWGSEAVVFGKKLCALLKETSGDPRSGYFFKQRISLAVQRGNAASVMGTFGPGRGLDMVDIGY